MTVAGQIDALAQEIRRVDGENSLGAGALAEALMPFLAAQHRREAEAGTPVAWRSTQGGISLSSEPFPGAHPLYLAASPSSPASGVRVNHADLVRRLTVAADGVEKISWDRRSLRRGYEELLREAASALGEHP